MKVPSLRRKTAVPESVRVRTLRVLETHAKRALDPEEMPLGTDNTGKAAWWHPLGGAVLIPGERAGSFEALALHATLSGSRFAGVSQDIQSSAQRLATMRACEAKVQFIALRGMRPSWAVENETTELDILDTLRRHQNPERGVQELRELISAHAFIGTEGKAEVEQIIKDMLQHATLEHAASVIPHTPVGNNIYTALERAKIPIETRPAPKESTPKESRTTSTKLPVLDLSFEETEMQRALEEGAKTPAQTEKPWKSKTLGEVQGAELIVPNAPLARALAWLALRLEIERAWHGLGMVAAELDALGSLRTHPALNRINLNHLQETGLGLMLHVSGGHTQGELLCGSACWNEICAHHFGLHLVSLDKQSEFDAWLYAHASRGRSWSSISAATQAQRDEKEVPRSIIPRPISHIKPMPKLRDTPGYSLAFSSRGVMSLRTLEMDTAVLERPLELAELLSPHAPPAAPGAPKKSKNKKATEEEYAPNPWATAWATAQAKQ